MSNLDKPLGEQFYPLWKAVGINDTTFQIKGRFDKESESAGTKYKVGKQVFCFSLRDERTKQERFYMDVSSDPTLIDAAEGVYEYTIASVDHRGIQSDNTVTPPTKYSSSNRKTHAAGQYVGIVVSPEYFSEVQEDFIAASTIATAVAGENLVANNTVSLHTDAKLYKYHYTNYPNVVGFVASAYTAPATATYTTFGGVATGLTGLTPGATLFAESTGAYTHTGSSTTTPIGKALTTTTARLYLTTTELVKATESEAQAGTDNANYMTPLRTSQHGYLGEIRQFAVTIAGALSVATLRGYGWAVCDGTTPAAQGITSPTIVTTPNLVDKFLRGDATASGTTGGAATFALPNHTHLVSGTTSTATGTIYGTSAGNATATHSHTVSITSNNPGTNPNIDTVPPFYEVVFMMKVK